MQTISNNKKQCRISAGKKMYHVAFGTWHNNCTQLCVIFYCIILNFLIVKAPSMNSLKASQFFRRDDCVSKVKKFWVKIEYLLQWTGNYDHLKQYYWLVGNFDVYFQVKNHIYPSFLPWNITKILQAYFGYFGYV